MNLLEFIRLSDVEACKYLEEQCEKIQTLEDAFRISFYKWLYIDYCERKHKLTDCVIHDIAKSPDTCGLCKWDCMMLVEHGYSKYDVEHWCKFCPIGRKDDEDACFEEFELWIDGKIYAIGVYQRIAETYEKLLLKDEIEPFVGEKYE